MSKTPDSIPAHPFLTQNQEEFAGLLTFLDFSAEAFTIGFAEVNLAAESTVLVQALKEHPRCQNYKFEVFNFSRQPDLRFLRDELVQRLKPLPEVTEQLPCKRIVIVQGLEASIGTDGIGEYPPVLQDLNFVRDAYRTSVPYPVLFILPDYALTRLAKYAPDFWAWRSAVFLFKAHAKTRQELHTEVFDTPRPVIAAPENQALIDRLNQLLMEYHPSGREIAEENLAVCADINYKLGDAYLTQRQFSKAIDYFQETRKIAQQKQDKFLEQSTEERLGDAYRENRQFGQAKTSYLLAHRLAENLKDTRGIVSTLFGLGTVALEQRKFSEAKDYYETCLKIERQQNNRYAQASIYHRLGIVAEELREFYEARTYYQKALDIKIEFNDRYAQAGTYHQLGRIVEELREFQAARAYYQNALDIKIEFNDRYGQAGTYYQLGMAAEELHEFQEASNYFLESLTIGV
jgi:tetratricopeptide (TPR) repeat protein